MLCSLYISPLFPSRPSGEKPYQCEVCGRCFRQVGQVRTHQRVHATEQWGTLFDARGLGMGGKRTKKEGKRTKKEGKRTKKKEREQKRKKEWEGDGDEERGKGMLERMWEHGRLLDWFVLIPLFLTSKCWFLTVCCFFPWWSFSPTLPLFPLLPHPISLLLPGLFYYINSAVTNTPLFFSSHLFFSVLVPCLLYIFINGSASVN